MEMKKLSRLVPVLLALVLAAVTLDAADKGTSKEMTIEGEIVDINCYLAHGKSGLGKGHAKCANKCIENGLPVGVKVGDDIYIAAMAGHKPANKELAPYAGKKIKVKGNVMTRGSHKFIAIKQIGDDEK